MPHDCPDCGKENNDTARFCQDCGGKLDSSATRIIPAARIIDNRYEIVSAIKSGAMGCVYKAQDKRLGNIVAVKQMLPSFIDGKDLETIIHERGRKPFSVDETLDIFMQEGCRC